jgi:hypothetical protein
MTEPEYRFGQGAKVGNRWFSVVSMPDGRGLHPWRDGQMYTVRELVDFAEEKRIAEAPLPPEPDPLRGYAVVQSMA